MKKLLRIVAVAVMGLSLTTGVAAANSGSVGTTGPNSNNQVEFNDRRDRTVENNNRVGVTNSNPQDAVSGDATAVNNTTAGGAMTGVARNDSLTRATVRLNNSSAMPASESSSSHSAVINNTGPSSNNQVTTNSRSTVTVTNNNNVTVTNTNDQDATSGDAVVSGNTTGGTAQSGGAENISTNEFVFEITN